MVEEQDCKLDVDCPALEICYQTGGKNRCVDPCTTIAPCVANAQCRVHSTTPTRTMSCLCFEGFTGNGVVSCDKIGKTVNVRKQETQTNCSFTILVAPLEVGCSSDDECAFTQACRNRACINPCALENPCSSSAECTVSNHRPVCKCPAGFTGDPYTKCVPSE